MTVTYQPIQRIDETAFRMTFSSDQTPPVDFRIYREGVEIQTITSSTGTGSIVLTIGAGESPFVEVLDMPCQIPSIAFPGKLTLNWLSISGAATYQVQEYEGAAWVTLQTIIDNGSGVFSYLTPWLNDVTSHQFQVVPVDSFGNAGTPIGFTVEMVRHPNAPNITTSFSAGVVSVSG